MGLPNETKVENTEFNEHDLANGCVTLVLAS